ncbi:MAG TPA: ATP-binding protein, partial [Acetobacteraceae bacterium]|nr:ATP-binding protein [Acetobacteraceae bacterium]
APRPPPPDILLQLAQYRPPATEPAAAPAPLTLEQESERAARLHATLHQVLAGEEAAFRPAGLLYQDFCTRLRILEIEGAPDFSAFRRMLANARAGVTPGEAETPDWQAATARAEALPEDAQGVYLLIARAARDGLPCPSDAAIARAYGTHSAGRARRLLGWLEERKAVVLRTERGGRRIALVGLGWETAAGDPNGPAEAPAAA